MDRLFRREADTTTWTLQDGQHRVSCICGQPPAQAASGSQNLRSGRGGTYG